jgi:hypothetical protein
MILAFPRAGNFRAAGNPVGTNLYLAYGAGQPIVTRRLFLCTGIEHQKSAAAFAIALSALTRLL